jgi:hypothetical protein
MADERKGFMAAGFGLLLRRQSVLWWVFIVNLVCGALGTAPAMRALSQALGHSLAGKPLTNGFDLGTFIELLRLPDVNIMRSATGSYVFAFVFFVFMLFVTGGILETYRQDRKLSISEFFGASGLFFWRFVRLMLLSMIPFAIAGMIYQGLSKAADHIGERAIADQVGIFLFWLAVFVFLVMALKIRLWFDVAQVRAVAQSERRMWRNLWRSLRILWGEPWRLFWIYFRIALVSWIILALCLVIWSKLGPSSMFLTFIVLEAIVFSQLATRLWQLASTTAWYKNHAEMVPADTVDYTTPHPVEVVETTPTPEPIMPPDPSPQLPPADA